MTVLAFAILVLAVVVLSVLHVRMSRRLEQEHRDREKRLEESVAARRVMLDKQAKVFVRRLARSNNAAMKLIDQSRNFHEDARQLHAVAEELIREVKARG